MIKEPLHHIVSKVQSVFYAKRKWIVGSICVWLFIIVSIILWPMDVEQYFVVKPSPELRDRNGQLLYPLLNQDDAWCFVRDLDEISTYLIQATIAAEDQRFQYHVGVDPIAIVRAGYSNLMGQRIVSGASTLPMQVVKFQIENTNQILGKLLQAVESVRLCARVEREKILWTYFNNVAYGSNLIGCESAARRYFGKPASELTIAEAALLAGLPKAPSYYLPTKHPKRALVRRNSVLQRMWQEGCITRAQYTQAKKRPLGVEWHEFPKQAPHTAFQFTDALQKSIRVNTTIDSTVQKKVERFVKAAVVETGGQVNNAAAIIVDVSSASILARVGSSDFLNADIDGQVDCCLARRSPGSALKPFVYGLAMEKNQLYASEMLMDYRWDRGLYNPENFDSIYKGLMDAGLALRTSRNVPALTVLERVGVKSLHEFLTSLEFSTLDYTPERYGLGITLGNCEVRLDEMTAVYTMIASLGEFRPLKICSDSTPSLGTTVLSKGTCVKLFEMLEQPLPDEWIKNRISTIDNQTRACFKTGTSAGYRDAWCFMFNRHYVVGVWMGNNDGSGSKALVGARVAVPLAAKIFRSLPLKNEPYWPLTNDAFSEITICAVSGLPASPFCQHTKTTTCPTHQFLHRRCDMHYPSSQENGDQEIIERWPASPKGWNLAQIDVPFVKQKKTQKAIHELQILSPPDKSRYVLTGELQGDRIQLKTSLDGEDTIHWYLNGAYLGCSSENQSLYLPLSKGENTLSCMNSLGQIDSIEFTVLTPQEISRQSIQM
jgi:penicillin-binding protein 1C